MIKKQRGSAAVLALVMLLFLSLAGGAWVLMHAQDNATALSDAKEQQAWYAAEAGMKRAKAEFTAKNASWGWLTSDPDFKKDFKYRAITDGTSTDAADNKAKYGVFIAPKDSNDVLNAAPTASVTYSVTSVGEYMGTRKVIKEDLALAESGGGGGGTSSDSITGKGDLTIAGGNVSIDNSVADADNVGVKGSINSSGITDHRKNDHGAGNIDYKGAYNGKLYTKIAAEAFDENTYGTFTEVATVNGNQTALALSNKEPVKVQWPIKWIASWSPTGGVFDYQITGQSGSVLYFYLTGSNTNSWQAVANGYGVYTTDDIIGPSGGDPMTLIFDQDVTILGNISGNIRIIGKGNVTIGNGGSVEGNVMIVSNGNVTIDCHSKKAKYFVSSDGTVKITSTCQSFIGQIQAAGDVYLAASKNQTDTTVIDAFNLPLMVLHGS